MIIEKKNYDAINYKLDCNDLKKKNSMIKMRKIKRKKFQNHQKEIFMEFYFVLVENFGIFFNLLQNLKISLFLNKNSTFFCKNHPKILRKNITIDKFYCNFLFHFHLKYFRFHTKSDAHRLLVVYINLCDSLELFSKRMPLTNPSQ